MVRVINYSGRQCFSLSGGASNKLSRLKIRKFYLLIEFSFYLFKISTYFNKTLVIYILTKVSFLSNFYLFFLFLRFLSSSKILYSSSSSVTSIISFCLFFSFSFTLLFLFTFSFSSFNFLSNFFLLLLTSFLSTYHTTRLFTV